jgi:PAS domain S-box-containing protein
VIHNGETVLDCNSAYARMFGYEDAQDVIGRPTTAFVIPESSAVVRANNLNKQEQPYEAEARRKDGSTFPVQFVGREAEWQGQPVRIGLARDLTEQHRAEATIRESHARHEAAVHASGHLFYDWNAATNVITFADNIEQVVGYTAGEINGDLSRWLEIIHPEDRDAVSTETHRVIATGDPFRLDYRVFCKDGRLIDVEDEGYFLRGTRGHNAQMVGFVRDVTARKQAERDREAEKARLEAVLRQSPVGIIIAEAPSGRLILGNEQVARIWRHEFQAPSEIDEYRRYRGFERGTGRKLEPREWPVVRSITNGEVVINEEIDIERGDGSRGTVIVNSAPIFEEQNRIVAAVVVFSDITERAVAERHQSLLIHELNHRVKNTLATVQSIAAQSFRTIGEEARPNLKTFEERLFALARAHDVLTRESWDRAELREIITEILGPYLRQAGTRFEITGPRLRLPPKMALALAMALHELATNASKYGALSTPSGRVLIHWTVAENAPPLLILTWEEQGGPPVVQPRRKGFGTRLIERSLAMELGGEVRLSYEASGLVCEVRAPLQTEEHPSKN